MRFMWTTASRVDVVGRAEIAQRLRVRPRTVSQWRWRGVLPEPDSRVGEWGCVVVGDDPGVSEADALDPMWPLADARSARRAGEPGDGHPQRPVPAQGRMVAGDVICSISDPNRSLRS